MIRENIVESISIDYLLFFVTDGSECFLTTYMLFAPGMKSCSRSFPEYVLILFKLSCSLESPGEFLKIQMPRLHMCYSESLEVREEGGT